MTPDERADEVRETRVHHARSLLRAAYTPAASSYVVDYQILDIVTRHLDAIAREATDFLAAEGLA